MRVIHCWNGFALEGTRFVGHHISLACSVRFKGVKTAQVAKLMLMSLARIPGARFFSSVIALGDC
jgi:hypothetical protein